MTTPRRSRAITEGDERAPNRSMLRAVGFADADFQKPIVGVASAHSNLTPCNVGIGPLADRAMEALRAAGTMPQVFGTITVSDGISMGTEGMKYSLVSREVIADSIETVCNAQAMDGVLAIGGCDKNMPGAMIAFARLDIPAIFVYGGTIKPGCHEGRDLNIVSVFEALGQYEAGKLPHAELDAIERKAIPGAGACGGMYTANTMSSAFEALGMSLTWVVHDGRRGRREGGEHGRVGPRARGGDPQRRSPRSGSSPGRPSRTRSPWSWRSAGPRTPSSTSWRSPMRPGCRSPSTTSRRSGPGCRCSATSSPPAVTSRPSSTGREACRR